MKKLLLGFLGLLTGCSSLHSIVIPKSANPVTEAITSVQPTETLTILSGVGGICLLAGMALLVISRGTLGWRPVIGGVLLVILNYAVAEFAEWIFFPAIIATGAISLCWGWSVVCNILKIHKEKTHG
jgi:hypothetical protein